MRQQYRVPYAIEKIISRLDPNQGPRLEREGVPGLGRRATGGGSPKTTTIAWPASPGVTLRLLLLRATLSAAHGQKATRQTAGGCRAAGACGRVPGWLPPWPASVRRKRADVPRRFRRLWCAPGGVRLPHHR